MTHGLQPRHQGYLADPFLLRDGGSYLLYGSADPELHLASAPAIASPDLETWRVLEPVLRGVPPESGRDVWAPEVAFAGGMYWMYYSVGHGIEGHHIRVARAERAEGPFVDLGLNLTPGESFAIDAHPFRDADGNWYLYLARDVLDHPRRGTHLAVAPLIGMTELGPITPVLAPDSPWQLFEHDRDLYGRTADWWTLEGPAVVHHAGRYVLLFSGGRWETEGYGVSAAFADHPLGPWRHRPGAEAEVLSTAIVGVPGPGHCSVLSQPDGTTLIAFHGWDAERRRRQPYIERLGWAEGEPRLERRPSSARTASTA